MKILTLCYEYPPLGGGGGRAAAAVAKALRERGHEVRLCTAALGGRSFEENDGGVRVIRTGSFRRKADTCSVPEMGLYVATSFGPARRQIREWKPDVIHAHFAVPTGALAWALQRLTGTPYVLTAHLGDVPGGVPEQTGALFRWIKPFTRPIWKNAAALTTVSPFVAELAARAYGRLPEVIPNGIPLPPPPEPRRHQPPRILWVGRLSVQKNPRLALESLAALGDLPWELHVVGDGPLRGELEDQSARLHLAERVTFHGWEDSPRVAELMRSSDLLLMTSLSEGFPMVVVEALAHGLPVAATDIPALRGVILPGENGRLAAPPDLGAALRGLLKDPETRARLAEGARASAARYDLREIARRYEAVLIKAAAR
ncbi:MAG TPA: glycosyltransferase family 4 protein [Chthoniobacterales bacterium]